MNCENCGKFNEIGQNYCRFCGAPLTQRQTQNTPNQQPSPYGWASESSSLHNVDPNFVSDFSTESPPQVQPLVKFPQQDNQTIVQNRQTQPLHGYNCPYCKTTTPPINISKISDSGWAVFIVMLLFCLPLFWIGLLMTENRRICPVCGLRLG
ncbi:MAG: hypothetical protein H7Z37_13500 [Pyrinomonadaceae bacterium]|nr:hypothetical protein [Pyrinomonadaceae bacterium]